MTTAIARTTVPGARGTTSSPPPTDGSPPSGFATLARFGTLTRVVVTALDVTPLALVRAVLLVAVQQHGLVPSLGERLDGRCVRIRLGVFTVEALFQFRLESGIRRARDSHALARSAACASACRNRARRSSTSASRSDLHLS